MERNIRKFDISKPLQAFQFATFLLRLKTHSEQFAIDFEKEYMDGYMKALLELESQCHNWAMSDATTDKEDEVELEAVQEHEIDETAFNIVLEKDEEESRDARFQAMKIQLSHESKTRS